MKKKMLLALSVLLVAVLVVRPYDGRAESELEKIERELKQYQQEMNRQAQEKKNAEAEVNNLQNRKEATKEEIQKLLEYIDMVAVRLSKTMQEIEEKEQQLEKTVQELDEAIARLEDRDELLQNRIRLMYTNGAVSYLDVLLNATSFSDFLDRFDALESITNQDRKILEEKKREKAEVEEKKAEVEQQLAEVKQLYKETEERKVELESKEREKEVLVASLNQEIAHMEEISEEAENALMDLAKKVSQLEAEKNRIKTYYTGGKLGMPLKDSYTLTSKFGMRTHPVTGQKKLHSGMDMGAPKGTPVYAAESGVVLVAQFWSSYGNCIIIDHGGGLWTVYGHLQQGGILVEKGETVKRGEKIGLVGSTGVSTGNHLHFEVRKDSTPVDPSSYLK